MSLILFLVGVVCLSLGVFCFNGFVPANPRQHSIANAYGVILIIYGGGSAMIGLLGMLP